MVTVTIKAVYENGVLRPLEPLDLPENQVVEIRVQPELETTESAVKLGGALVPHLTGPMPGHDELETFFREEHQRSQERLFHQLDGDSGNEPEP